MSQSFQELGLRPEIVESLTELGFETPSPIQAQAIPLLIAGQDVMGQAQTGTGKTAAFGLPLLQTLHLEEPGVQGLILTPTRELAIQVSQAIFSYGKAMGVRVVPIYGGQSYTRQMSRLRRDTHVVVGTPGRTLDLIQRDALDLSNVRYLVLDEADEMLKMGFIDDVEAILQATSSDRQTALFSATFSSTIRRLAERYMHSPHEVTIERKTLTVEGTEQRYYLIDDHFKLAALALLLEVEALESVLIFTRTKVGAAELAESLIARGYYAEALHGDLDQTARETILRRFRNGQVRVLVGTDVVARGVDIPHVSHVINYDMPHDSEDYVHRIGRTGRAGREGVAISLVTPAETRYLRDVERYTRQRIERATLPDKAAVFARRDERFVEEVNRTLQADMLGQEKALILELQQSGYDLIDLAAAMMQLARKDENLRPVQEVHEARERVKVAAKVRTEQKQRGNRRDRQPEEGMVKFRLNLGRIHGIRPGDVVGAIASEAGIPGKAIGAIEIQNQQTLVDVKEDYAEKVSKNMKRATLRGQPMQLSRV